MLFFLATDFIEQVFHLGRELVIHQARKVLFQQPDNGKGDPGWDQRVAAFKYVFAPQNRLDNRRIRAWAADPHLLQGSCE